MSAEFGVEHILCLSEQGSVFAYADEHELADGGRFDIRFATAMRVHDGRVASLDFYDEHDVEAACAALDEEGTELAAERFANVAGGPPSGPSKRWTRRRFPAFRAGAGTRLSVPRLPNGHAVPRRGRRRARRPTSHV